MRNLLLITICVMIFLGCKDRTEPENKINSIEPVSSISEPNNSNVITLEEAVLKSIKEYLEEKRTQEAIAIIELHENGNWLIGGQQITQDEIKEIPLIMKQQNMPLNVQLQVPKEMDSQVLISTIDKLKLSGAEKVTIVVIN